MPPSKTDALPPPVMGLALGDLLDVWPASALYSPHTIVYARAELGTSGAAWRDTDAANDVGVVFVHGWGGHFDETWTWSPPLLFRRGRRPVLIVDLLTADASLKCDYYSLSHSVGGFTPTDIDTAAGSLVTFLKNYVSNPNVVLVSHSLGGLICRKAVVLLLDAIGSSAIRISGLLMYGTPNNGTELARLAREGLPSPSGAEMEPVGKYLAELNRLWIQRIVNGGDPALDSDRRYRLYCKSVIGEEDRVVPPTSAASLVYLGDIEVVRKDHRGLPKAESASDPSLTVLRRFILDCRAGMTNRPLLQAAERFAERTRQQIMEAALSYGEDWLRDETTQITLSVEPGLTAVGLDGADLLRCRIHSVWRGRVVPRVFNICVSVGDHEPTDREIAYQHKIGRGLMGESAYSALAESLKNAVPSDGRFGPHLFVDSLAVVSAGRRFEYLLSPNESVADAGVLIACFKCPAEVGDVGQESSFEMNIRTLVTRSQGWYNYFSEQPILERLVVSLVTPFSTSVLERLSWEGAEYREGGIGQGSYRSEVEVKGLIPPNTNIDWIFGR